MRISLKGGNKLTIWPNNPTTGHKPKRPERLLPKPWLHRHVYSSTFYISQNMKPTKVSVMRLTNKDLYAYTHTQKYYSVIKRIKLYHFNQNACSWKISYPYWILALQVTTLSYYGTTLDTDDGYSEVKWYLIVVLFAIPWWLVILSISSWVYWLSYKCWSILNLCIYFCQWNLPFVIL